MSALGDSVLPLIRTRTDLYRWSAANEHGRRMHDAIDVLEAALSAADPADAHTVVQAALASAVKVIAKADDSSGIIGDACRRLLELHPTSAAAAKVPAPKLVDWMLKFQFEGDVDYFEIDPVAYAPALGSKGIELYRDRLDAIRAKLGPEPTQTQRWTGPDQHERWVLSWNDKRLAVHDRDVNAIIRTHAKDRKVAAWLHDTAKAFEEIGDIELAVDWADQATHHDHGHQSLTASNYWCELLAMHRPNEHVAACQHVFQRWPSATTATRLHHAAANNWPEYHETVLESLAARPDQAVMFSLHTLGNTQLAWDQAIALNLENNDVWADLTDKYAHIDPLAVLPIHRRLVEAELLSTDAKHYRNAAKRLAKMRGLAAHTEQLHEVDSFITELRVSNRRRPRLQQEFDKAKLP